MEALISIITLFKTYLGWLDSIKLYVISFILIVRSKA